jgi:acid phosphatase type 7
MKHWYTVLAFLAVIAPLAYSACGGDEATGPLPAASATGGGGVGAMGGAGGDGGTPPPKNCGNAVCDADETCQNCEGDCGSCACGDGTCADSELCGTCPEDCGVCTGEPITVTRGPYLQRGSSNAVVVRWRTAEPTPSAVAFGPSIIALSSVAKSSEPTTEHEIEVTGLSADSKVHYAFGAPESPLLGGDGDHFVITAPPVGTDRATRIWVLGDSGTANAKAAAVRDAYLAHTGNSPTHLWLMLGDNAYADGTDEEYQKAVFDMYPSVLRNSVLWSTLGNHDGHSADSGTQSGPYYDIHTLPTAGEAGGVASGTEAYYSFDYGQIHFVCLDSYDSDTSVSGDMLTWLESDLGATTQPWLIAFFHHPPYSKGSHDSDTESRLKNMRERAMPILEAHGVDLILSGHSHSYERSMYLNGHYGVASTLESSMIVDDGDGRVDGDGAYVRSQSSTLGAVYVVAGSSGKISGGALDHPAMLVSLNELGSVVVDVEANIMDVGFVDDVGAVVDWFTIKKQ